LQSIDGLEARYVDMLKTTLEEVKCIQNAREVIKSLPAVERLAMFLIDAEHSERPEFGLSVKDKWWYPFYEYAQNRAKSLLQNENPWDHEDYREYLERAKRILEHTDLETVMNIYEDIIHPNNKRREPTF
jgi:hypothetical protein